MRSIVSKADRLPELPTLELPLVGAVPSLPSTFHPVGGDWVLPLVGQAIDAVMQRKEAAILMGMDASQLTKQLHAEGHLSVRRLGALPERFWLALASELRAHFGLLDRAQMIAQGEALIDRGRQLLAQAAAR